MARKSFVLVAVALGLLSCATSPAGAPAAEQRRVSSNLPDFELTTVEGDASRLSEYLGRDVVLLAFWSTWCEPCKTELPHLDRIYRARKDQGFVVLAIAMDDPTTLMQVAPYVHESGFAFPVLLDPNSRAANLYNTHKTAPYTVLIARDGTIAKESPGFEAASIQALETQIDSLLAAVPR